MRRAKTWLLWLSLLAIPVVAVCAAGVTVSIANLTLAPIEQLTLSHEYGSKVFANLAPGERVKRKLGKLGEGTTFTLQVRRADQCLKAELEAYFRSSSGYTTIDFELLPDRQIRMLQDGKLDQETRLRPCGQ